MECKNCLKVFKKKHNAQMYCSESCKKKAHYLRHKERIKEYNLNRYHNNKKEILEYQINRLSIKYKTDKEFRKKRHLRDRSRNKIIGRGKTNLFNEEYTKCNTNEDLQRHHPSYDSTEFIILCRNCHNKVHKSKI